MRNDFLRESTTQVRFTSQIFFLSAIEMSPSKPNFLGSILNQWREAGTAGPQKEFIPKQKKTNTKKYLFLCTDS